MDISLEWHAPILLRDASDSFQSYACDLELVPPKPGIYVFARRFGRSVFPLYVGQAQRLRARVKSQFNNLRLMKAIEEELAGSRILLLATLKPRGGQRINRLLDIVEKAYIERAVLDGCELINKQGTRLRLHTISSVGKQSFHTPFPRKLSHKAR